MEILPTEYQHIELSRSEKIFTRNVMSNEQYGFLILNTNPSMIPLGCMHALICSDGILFLKFFDKTEKADDFGSVLPTLVKMFYNDAAEIISKKLLANKALVDETGDLKFPVDILFVFPAFIRNEVSDLENKQLKEFISNHCLFKEELQKIRSNLFEIEARFFAHPIIKVARKRFKINNNNINSILQRITSEYIIPRVSTQTGSKTKAGADKELLVITENDPAVKAYRLDAEQINIVNKIHKGEQLILACAGSGKSVLLIAKCFKAAKMNPNKRFLITCYNNNLYSLYTWFIDMAGLKAKNVTCMTFHTLCKKLLSNNGYPVANRDFDRWVSDVIQRFNEGKISERFYGIFIDEVQQFRQEWYKFCFNLLENRNTEDHLFVICGDKTQKLANLQKHGRAPWNAGEGYPNYRGGNKSIRIERNYRNCIEINEYINRYVINAKQYLLSINKNMILDPDEFLRGKSISKGEGVTLKYLVKRSNRSEAITVIDSIKEIHDVKGIPYDEIAVIMYNRSYKKYFKGWNSKDYNLEYPLQMQLDKEDIPYCTMYATDGNWGARYGADGGVRLITFMATLGLDFRAAIVCGILPLGEHDGTKNLDWQLIKNDEDAFQEKLEDTLNNIRLLYVACTRAKEILHIILPETRNSSVYIKMLEDANNIEGIENE